MRFESLKTLSTRKNFITENKSISFTNLFNSNVFNDSAMRDFLSREAYESVSNSIKDGITINRKMAEHVASGMKRWALSKGATHYTHGSNLLLALLLRSTILFLNPKMVKPLKNSLLEH
jgi:glutamine synthetase